MKRWKLMVLGGSGDGKTSMIKRLLNLGFTEDHIVTNGIESECKVSVTKCDKNWKIEENSSLTMLEKDVLEGLFEWINSCSDEPSEKKQKMSDTVPTVLNEETKEILEALSEVSDANISLTKEIDPFTLFIWDYGGQVVYYVLHSIFIRSRCVYIVVVKLSRSLHKSVPAHELPPHTRSKQIKYWQQIDYWLRTIFSHSAKQKGQDPANIIIVGTHKDQLQGDAEAQQDAAIKYFEELDDLLSRYAYYRSVHREFIAVDSKGGDEDNYARLRKLIMQVIEENGGWNKKRPVRWLRLEAMLHKLREEKSLAYIDRNIICHETMKKYATEYHIETEEDLRTFLRFHHLTADITYYEGAENSYVMPHAQWLIDVLRALITLENFYPKSEQGRMRFSAQEKRKLLSQGLIKARGQLLKDIWKPFLEGDYSGKIKEHLLGLLCHYDLAVPFDYGQYLLPCMLPYCENSTYPELKNFHLVDRSLFFRFHFSMESYKEEFRHGDETFDHFLPHGLFQRLMVRCSKQGWKWFLKYQNAVAFDAGDDVTVLLKTHVSAISLTLLGHKPNMTPPRTPYFHTVSTQLDDLLKMNHENMWYDLCLCPCEGEQGIYEEECMGTTGLNSIEKDSVPRMVRCIKHGKTLSSDTVTQWISKVCIITKDQLAFFFSIWSHPSFP